MKANPLLTCPLVPVQSFALMTALRHLACLLVACAGMTFQNSALSAQSCGKTGVQGPVYILGDSISYGLHQEGLEARLQKTTGGSVRISYDIGRSITSPGVQIKKTALESVDEDQAFIAKAKAIILVLGTNQVETSFENSQQLLMWKLRSLAPEAHYYWVDIGATIATQVAGWNARNEVIYRNAHDLDYSVISRYKAIFGAEADPLKITPGRNFPGWVTEPGYGGEGNLHGGSAELANVILATLGGPSGDLNSGAGANGVSGGCTSGG
jgi:hypothetical protein